MRAARYDACMQICQLAQSTGLRGGSRPGVLLTSRRLNRSLWQSLAMQASSDVGSSLELLEQPSTRLFIAEWLSNNTEEFTQIVPDFSRRSRWRHPDFTLMGFQQNSAKSFG